jgi:hypothetical protein
VHQGFALLPCLWAYEGMALAARKTACLLLRGHLSLSSTLTGVGGAPATLSCSHVRNFAAQAPQKPEDDDTFELLPPGCSLADPTYGRSFGRDGKHRWGPHTSCTNWHLFRASANAPYAVKVSSRTPTIICHPTLLG